jgi:hypothetical protein
VAVKAADTAVTAAEAKRSGREERHEERQLADGPEECA